MRLGFLFDPDPTKCQLLAPDGTPIDGFCGANIQMTDDGHRLVIELADFTLLTPQEMNIARPAPQPSQN